VLFSGFQNLAAGCWRRKPVMAKQIVSRHPVLQNFHKFSQIFSCENSAIMASSNIFLRKDARFGGIQPQLAKRATAAGYKPKLL
jgi:hypothetical protein